MPLRAAITPANASQIAGPATRSLSCWCQAGSWRESFRTLKFGLLRCTACGCYRIDPVPVAVASESEAFYTEYYSRLKLDAKPLDSAAGFRSSHFWRVVEKVGMLEPPRRAVADMGCGDGHLCAELRAAGWPIVIGFEVSRTRILRARKFYPGIEFYDRPIAKSGIAPGSLDLIVMDSVIEHLPDPDGMLRELRSFLAPSGRLVVLSPNMESGHFRFLGRRWTGMLAPHAHIFLFTGAALSRLLSNTGYSLDAIGSFHAPPYMPLDYIRRLASGDIKGAVWRLHQELGGFYGRLLGAGPMLYAVAALLPRDQRS